MTRSGGFFVDMRGLCRDNVRIKSHVNYFRPGWSCIVWESNHEQRHELQGVHGKHGLRCRRQDHVGRVLGIDDIIAFHAESVAEFEAGFHAAIDAYIAACAALDSEPEKAASGKLMLRIAPEIHAAAMKARLRAKPS